MKASRISLTSVVAATLTLCCSTLCPAQSAPATPARNSVAIFHIKPDMVTDWTDLVKNEVLPAYKKAGVPTFTTYQTVFGNSNEYVGVVPIDKYAVYDGPNPLVQTLGATAAARLATKLRRCEDSVQIFIGNPLPALSNPPAGEMPAYGVFTRIRVADGKMQEYQDLMKAEILPIYKKANAPFTVTRRSLGANGNDLTTVVWLSKAADLDAGPLTVRTLGQAGYAKYLAKAGSMATLVEQVVRHRMPELSY